MKFKLSHTLLSPKKITCFLAILALIPCGKVFSKTFPTSAVPSNMKKRPVFSKIILQDNIIEQSKPYSDDSEYIIVKKKKINYFTQFERQKYPLKYFEDGHSERTFPLLGTIVFGAVKERDPVTGTSLKHFGEAYEDSNPLQK